jgi:hypothetical protein
MVFGRKLQFSAISIVIEPRTIVLVDNYGYHPISWVFINNYGYRAVTLVIVNNYGYRTDIYSYWSVIKDIGLIVQTACHTIILLKEINHKYKALRETDYMITLGKEENQAIS